MLLRDFLIGGVNRDKTFSIGTFGFDEMSSLGIVIFAELDPAANTSDTVNEKLVKMNFATSNAFDENEDGFRDSMDSGLPTEDDDWNPVDSASEDFNPMVEDFQDVTNNYVTNDDDIKQLTDGYKSKDRVCCQFVNRGSCYKGDYCEDKHIRRAGAVTADREEVYTGTGKMFVASVCMMCVAIWSLMFHTEYRMELPPLGDTVWVRVADITNPSSFYITFPLSDTIDIAPQRKPSDAYREWELSKPFTEMLTSMQEMYQKLSKKMHLSSYPAPAQLIAAKEEFSRKWQRAIVRDMVDDESVEVFFVDLGRVQTVPLTGVRKLDPSFTFLPYQAVEAALYSVQPRPGGWSGAATKHFKRFVRENVLLQAKVRAYVHHKPQIFIDLSGSGN